jgi:hypothetical protein
MSAHFRWPFLLAIATSLACCSKSDDQSRHFLFARSDSQTVHDTAISANLARLRTSDPDAYLRLLRTEKGDAAWLDALKTVHPALYQTEFDKRAANASTDSQASRDSSPIPSSPNWLYVSTPDEMRGKSTDSACIESGNELYFGFPYGGGSHGELCIRKSPKFGGDVYLTINNGQFLCAAYLGCQVRVKFDGNSIWVLPAAEASDGTTNVIFIRGYGRMVRSLKSSKKVIVEANFYQAGEQQLTFDVSGLKWE